ncbi:hypothetical protein MATL_G00014030 [Megalops atlanticus]|uniref:Coatomer subunit zeta n=1 Tax=Megalops atlanticus TaxID=7932 RepID=A0A9D3TEP7_MEGAT|nr:hypothetical protein MATL_G00014030 [Megalops atlanticus]
MDLTALFYDPELYLSIKEQKNFEQNIFNKTHKADNEMALLEGLTVIYKRSIDLFIYVVVSAQENEKECGEEVSAGQHGWSIPGRG